MNNKRKKFREKCLSRSGGSTCTVPWCDEKPDDVHHIIERKCWKNGGYIPENGAPLCSKHHKHAEKNYIPPQALWRWLDLEPTTPRDIEDWNIDKWGNEFRKPSDQWKNENEEISEQRDYVKQPSTIHLPFSQEDSDSDNFYKYEDMENFSDIPLVITIKMDGSNAYVSNERVASRKGWGATHETYDHLKRMHASFKHKIPSELQIFGEWLKHKHSIHYAPSNECTCEDNAPPLDSFFQVFNVYDNKYNLWLSWYEVKEWADKIGVTTTPVLKENLVYENKYEAAEKLREIAEGVVEEGHEGIVVRPMYPFHYGQFDRVVGKYVRNNHVKTEEHWKYQDKIENHLKD